MARSAEALPRYTAELDGLKADQGGCGIHGSLTISPENGTRIYANAAPSDCGSGNLTLTPRMPQEPAARPGSWSAASPTRGAAARPEPGPARSASAADPPETRA